MVSISVVFSVNLPTLAPKMASHSCFEVKWAKFYIDLLEKEDFLTNHIKERGFTDKFIKFFRSVMDGNLKFVKKALNQGLIRKDEILMLTSINLACRFGQPQVLEALVDKVSGDILTNKNFALVAVIIAGVTESKRLQVNQTPSGVLDILIKNAKQSYDKKTGKYISGKIDFNATKNVKSKFGFDESSTFFELCSINDEHIEYIIKKLLDANVVDVNMVLKDEDLFSGNSALVSAALTGNKEVVKIILDEMKWEVERDQYHEHIQQWLLHLMLDCSCQPDLEPSLPETYHAQLFIKREDRMDILQLLVEKCFRIIEKNLLGCVNDTFMDYFNKLKRKYTIHDHFDALVFEVIEEERRLAHGNGTLTWYDLNIKKGPKGLCHIESDGDTLERCIRAMNIDGGVVNHHGEAIDEDFIANFRKLKFTRCWSCGTEDSALLVCKQCRYARYCDALCQDEDWVKHKAFCQAKKEKVENDREGEREEDKRCRKKLRKLSKKCKEAEAGGIYDVKTWSSEKKY